MGDQSKPQPPPEWAVLYARGAVRIGMPTPEIEQHLVSRGLSQEAANRLSEQGIHLEVSDRFKAQVVTEGYNPSYGARPLRRAIMRLLEDVLAEEMLSGKLKEGQSAIVDVDENGVVKVLPDGSSEPKLPELALSH